MRRLGSNGGDWASLFSVPLSVGSELFLSELIMHSRATNVSIFKYCVEYNVLKTELLYDCFADPTIVPVYSLTFPSVPGVACATCM